ncbi:chaperone [Lithospermum erythrorhizon]|uniref:Chaperone n=1 Tax=Lithospermum erythrorhizon TaxID=34254 RepID=A0AAV3Q4N2_LITER
MAKAVAVKTFRCSSFQFHTEDGDKVLPGFQDSIIRIQRGETKTFSFEFPESWKQEHLRGVNAEFTVECKELFYNDLTELNDSIVDRHLSSSVFLTPGCRLHLLVNPQVKNTLLERCQEMEKTAKEQAADNAILTR